MWAWASVRKSVSILLVLAGSYSGFASASQPDEDVLAVNLEPLILRAAAKPEAFAVNVQRAISPQKNGQWSKGAAGTLSWRYSVRIPESVSLSFHAASAFLPPSARLTVTAGNVVYHYSASDIHRGGLWSRIARGDSLFLELNVNAAEAANVRLAIDSLQAGYRSLDPDGRNHPVYERFRRQTEGAAQAAAATCVENYSCHVTTDNQGPGQSTAALIIGNGIQCSGVLLNDVPNDGTPYILTARHCEQGDSDGWSPDAAMSITVYWDATRACGAALGSIYDPDIPRQNGATTLVEQQDAWLMQLDQRPPDDVYFAGWDATGGSFVGGYTPHHALGNDRQFTSWYGQAIYETVSGASLGVGFDSTFWGTVNQVGSIGPGASGSGLFDADNRLVGTIVRGSSKGGTGVCPANPPNVPSSSTATALSTAFSGIFTSIEDPVSSTGAVTLQSVLDPGHTGTTVLDGAGTPPYILAFETYGTGPQSTGSQQNIYWYVANATNCTATGGVSGDGWSGSLPTSNIISITEYNAGTVTYGISCSNTHSTKTAQIQIAWVLGTPVVNISEVGLSPVAGMPFELQWNASLGPCSASGAASSNGWNGAQRPFGDASFIEPLPGTYTYKLTCGTGAVVASGHVVVTVNAPTVTLTALLSTMRVGQQVELDWVTTASSCVTTGGAAGDGWGGTQWTVSHMYVHVTELVAGTYTYGITCTSGSYPVSAQVQIVFTNDPPTVSLTVTPNQGTVANSSNVGYTYVKLEWHSNVAPCVISISGPAASADLPIYPNQYWPIGTFMDTRPVVGQYVYTATCGSGSDVAQASANATWTGVPDLHFTTVAATQYTGAPFGIYWQANVAPCVRTGGQPGDGWTDADTGESWTGTKIIRGVQPGAVTYAITCGTGADVVQASTSTTMVAAPPVTLTATSTTVGSGSAFTLSWNSNSTARCTRSGGVNGDGWSTGLDYPESGSVQLSEHTTSPVTFGITCGAMQSSVTINFVAEPAPSLDESVATAVVGTVITLTWSSVGPSTCIATGGSSTDIWSGTLSPAGTLNITEQVPDTYTYGIDCGSGLASVTVIFTAASVDTPPLPVTVKLGSSASAVEAANAFTLSWSSTEATDCSASGGGAGDGWTGTLPVSGTQSVTESTAGSYSFTVSCSNAGLSSSSMVTVTITAAASSGGGGGGGGGIDLVTLFLLAQVMVWRLAGAVDHVSPSRRTPPLH